MCSYLNVDGLNSILRDQGREVLLVSNSGALAVILNQQPPSFALRLEFPDKGSTKKNMIVQP